VVSVAGQPANRWVLQADVKNTGGSAAAFPATFWSETAGPFAANATTLTVIETPVLGWNSVTNTADAFQGLAADTDASLKTKRSEEITTNGSGTLHAIRAAVLDVIGIVPGAVTVFENTSVITDANGLPGKSFRVVFWDGPGQSASNAAIAQAIWNNRPAGIPSFGASSGTAIDAEGNPQTVNFDRATQVPIYLALTTTPASLTTQQTIDVKAALAAYAPALGQSVIAVALASRALGVGGVTDVPVFQLGTLPSPTGTSNIPISPLAIATLSTTNMVINGV
jgi:uncharacterized phage protein gp47/JayE